MVTSPFDGRLDLYAFENLTELRRQRQLPGRAATQWAEYASLLNPMEPVRVKLWNSSEGTGRFEQFDENGVTIRYGIISVSHGYNELQMLEPIFFRRLAGGLFETQIADAGYEVE